MSVFEDDPSVADAARLYRRVNPRFVVPDGNRNCMKLASGAFTDPELSVDIEDKLTELGLAPETTIGDYEDHCLVAFSAGVARGLQQVVCRDPEGGSESHGLVVGKKSRGQARSFARECEWVVPPENACQPPAI